MGRKSSIGAVVLFLIGVPCGAQAAVVTWDATSGLKPDQIASPYTLFDSASPEDPVLASNILTLTTDADTELMTYQMVGAALDMPAAPLIEFTMQVVSQSTSFPSLRTGAAVSITTQNSVGNIVYIGTDEVFFLTAGGNRGPENLTIDTDTTSHAYRIEVAGLGAGSTITLFQDNISVLNHVLINNAPNFGSEARIFFGNNTTLAHGVSQWSFFQHNAGAIPEPTTGAMLCFLLWATGRRKS